MNTKPVKILVAALGGEGGAVLADWIIGAAKAHDFPVQSTSIPGVAQRTGATTYYIEIFPRTRAELGTLVPVLALTPSAGDVDVIAASELIEAGRVIQNNLVDPQRTTLIASTHREYAISEKSAMGDGRFDETAVPAAARQMARLAILFDMRALALRHGTVINTVMFGAMAGAGALPVSKAACEAAIRAAGKSVEASLRGFEAGYRYAAGGIDGTIDETVPDPAPRAAQALPPRLAMLPEPVRALAAAGVAQLIDYQDEAYAGLYLDRVEALCGRERDGGGGPAGFAVAKEAARYLALWMSYEDVMRVADLKTRRARLLRVRAEVGARPGEPMILTEYLKPGLDELCSLLPPALAPRVRAYFSRRGRSLNLGMHIRTNTVAGFAMFAALRSLRFWRPYTSRYHDEQAMIERWLGAVHAALQCTGGLALELALCGNLVKGYGETNARGHRSLAMILADVEAATADAPATATADRVRQAREAALADPEGRQLAAALGLAAPAMKSKPLRFVSKASLSAGAGPAP